MVNIFSKWPGKGKKGDLFDLKSARVNALDILMGLEGRPSSYILLMGRKVQASFDLKGLEYLHRYRINRDAFRAHVVIAFPHPSGINTWWNDPDNVLQAEKLMRKVLHG